MQLSLLKQAAAWCASAMALATPAAFSQEWTDIKIGQFTPYAISYSHQPDGRFILGNGGQVFIQNTFGASESTALTNTPDHLLDPAFAIVRSATQGLVGAGGYGDPTGLYTFNPSTPTDSIATSPLTTIQNYSGTFWKHPTSGREGWLIVGQNAADFTSNITFVSVDGTTVGSLTTGLSSYSGGITVDTAGNVYTSLATDFGAADNNKILKLAAAQVDTAVAALLAENPAPIAKADIEVLYTADASSSIAVDSAGRVWTGGWQIEHLQAYDPATGVSRRFAPPIQLGGGSAFSSRTFAPGSFTKGGVDYVSFLLYDGSGFAGSDIVLGYAPVSELAVRSAQVALSQTSTNEQAEDVVTVTVTLTPAATSEITVPVTVTGSATVGLDYTSTIPNNIVFAPGETTKTYSITILDDEIKGEVNEIVRVRLGNPTPSTLAGLGVVGSEVATLTIVDDDIMPIIAFTSASQTVSENAGAVNVTVSITPTVTEQVTVPLTVTGTATSGEDFTVPTSLVIEPGDTTKILTIQVIDDSVANEVDETVIVTLGTPTPAGQAALGGVETRQFVLTIVDNDIKAIVSPEQNFGTLRVGTAFSVPVVTEGGTPTKWSAKGLPPGLKMNADGTISGTATKAGEYDQVVITTTNQYGVSTSVALLMVVEPFPASAVGTYSGLIDRTGTATEKLGARVTLTTTNKGTYSGKVVIGKKSHAIKGNLNATTLNPVGTANVGSQVLDFTINSTTGELTGSLPGAAELQGWQAQKSTDRTGIYNFYAAEAGTPSADVPQGASFGSLKLSTKAVANVSGKLADGSKFTSSSPLGVNGEVVIYQSLYKVQGTFSGAIALADNISHTITGDLTWSRPAQTSGTLYASGWETPLALVAKGGKYRPTAGATLLLGADPAVSSLDLLFQDGGIELVDSNENPKRLGVQVDAKKVFIGGPHKLKLTPKTGAFSGFLTLGDGSARRVAPFQGVLVPDTATENPFDSDGFGFFILQSPTPSVSRSGAVFLARP
jgi:hypothetical protein